MNASSPLGRFRWRICAVLFLATTINYINRNVFSFTMLDRVFSAPDAGQTARPTAHRG